jgi:hypothetical protein
MASVVSDSMIELLETAAEMSELRGRDWSREDRFDNDRSDRRFDSRYGDFRIAAEADKDEQIKQLQLQQQIRQQQMGRQTRPQSVFEDDDDTAAVMRARLIRQAELEQIADAAATAELDDEIDEDQLPSEFTAAQWGRGRGGWGRGG